MLSALWPETVVNEEALSRCVSRLRKLLGDDPRQPRFIETLPKRGYRLIAQHVDWLDDITTPESNNAEEKMKAQWPIFTVIALVLVALVLTFTRGPERASEQVPVNTVGELIRQADDYYHSISRQDNEMALELYQQAMALSPTASDAHSGMANALVQRVIRMPNETEGVDWEEGGLGLALLDGRLTTQDATLTLARAETLSQKAIELAPTSAKAHKAYGFVLSAQNQLDSALISYQKALALNPDAWDVLINMGDVYEISGKLTDAIEHYKKALQAMNRERAGQDNYGRPWRASLGASIADKYLVQNNLNDAEIWYRHVLSFAPFDARATKGLSSILKQTGRSEASTRLCENYVARVGTSAC